jgi:hypothetical protein
MTSLEMKADLERSKAEAEALAQLWLCLIGAAPDVRYFHALIYRHGYDATKKAVERTAVKCSQLNGTMSAEYQVKYCASCAKNETTQSEATRRKHNYPFVQDGAICSQK